MKKLPPIEKIYEAWSAIEDGRITLLDDGTQAVVTSSDGAKSYRVVRQIEDGKIIYRSNDKATYWQGYPGYPVIAMLMMEKQLALDLTVAGWFAGVNWHEVNMAHKSDYAAETGARDPCQPRCREGHGCTQGLGCPGRASVYPSKEVGLGP